MSVEFIRGPNVYLREMVVNDLTNIHACLVDWSWFPFSVDETKNVMRPHLQNLRYLERPYKDNARYWESFAVCKVSDNSFVGFRTLKIDNKKAEIIFNAALPALRGQGLMNEAAKLLVVHLVLVVSLSLNVQLTPLEPVGKFENLPVPSSHDCDTANTSKFKVLDKFLCSVDNNCKVTCEIPLLKVVDPILFAITSFMSSFLNLIKTLEG